ncbi:thioredoxin family protein [Holzapfeliella floricola]|uniref:Thioredoxin n=2 Tax=Holzapfeliella TaxID=2767883 RepID=A0A0R2DQ40_9LACO|nr:thioredoxin family protein [Holzapfeliella floricola]KRN03909.1 hypothetical protein FC86_GL001021 [Holzapfeliella floricola DSM 23037 = JCM 16512]
MEKMSNLSREDFKKLIAQKNTVVLMFSADWCGDCRFIKPQLPAIEAEFSKMTFYEVDRDQSMDVVQDLNIMGIPSFVVFRDGQEIGRLVNKNRKTKEEVISFLSNLG